MIPTYLLTNTNDHNAGPRATGGRPHPGHAPGPLPPSSTPPGLAGPPSRLRGYPPREAGPHPGGPAWSDQAPSPPKRAPPLLCVRDGAIPSSGSLSRCDDLLVD
eukprot:1135242-Prorocentrum_minimum.AAC.7